MRRAIASVLLPVVMVGGAVAAQPIGNPFDPSTVSLPRGYTMTSHEATAYARPHLHEIAHCYREHVKPAREVRGDISLFLVVGRTGHVVHSEVLAPGVAHAAVSPLESCIRHEVASWRFPRHPAFSNVTISYFYLDTLHPASGGRPHETPNV